MKKTRLPLWKRLIAVVALTLMALCISIVMGPLFLISDFFDYCSAGKWSQCIDEIWNGK